jgi:hypothetical protein
VHQRTLVTAYSVLYLKVEEEEKQKNDHAFQHLAWNL